MIELLVLVLLVVMFVSIRRSNDRIAGLEKNLAKLTDEIAAMRAGTSEPAAPAPTVPELQAAETTLPDSEEQPTTEGAAEPLMPSDIQAAAEVAPEIPTAAEEPPRADESLESYLGARWAVWAGGLALALGGLFLVRYSIESGLLGPGVRLALASLFGLALVATGEAIRRNLLPGISAAYSNAMIPGILTAAGVVSVFGAVYAAHGIYNFIGTAPTFLLLALTAFAALGLSLLHGQGLAGIGLLGSMLTPALVSSSSPSPWTLFAFLTLSLVATLAASRRQDWRVVPALAHVGMGGWATAYIFATVSGELLPAILALLAMLAAAAFLWPGRALEKAPADEAETEKFSEYGLALFLGRSPVGMNVALGFATIIPALAMLARVVAPDINPLHAMAFLIATLAAIGASRHSAVWPAILSAIAALLGVAAQAKIISTLVSMLDSGLDSAVLMPVVDGTAVIVSLGLGAFFVFAAFAFILRKGGRDPMFATLWAGIAATVPLAIAVITYIGYGDFVRDFTHGLYGIVLGLALLGGAEWILRAGLRERLSLVIDILVAGSFLALVFGVQALASGLTMTLLIVALGFVYVMATRLRDWRALPWMMVAASLGVLGRIAWEPTVVSPLVLGKTPVFNALLPGYGIPAALAIWSAYELRRWPSERVRNALQALASLMGLLAVAVLVRHAMNGGALTGTVPTLGEQSIYTLLVIGLSGVLMTLDLKQPSPVFRYGSMIAGALAMINVLTLHLGALNPFFSGENTGPWPFLNLLLIGYLLPAIAYAGLAWYARGKRPASYVSLLAVASAVLAFAWATLSVRRFWQGENIADWKGFLQGETYSYSVVWLAIGVGLLALGSRFDARSIRLASAALVMLSVAKAFLIDMSNLEGVLRALSFIGLGAVLIGIGLFYQKILTSRTPRAAAPTLSPDQEPGT